MYPTFRTNGNRIVPPEDVQSSSDPVYNNENLRWAGREVTQLRRSGDQTYYIGTFPYSGRLGVLTKKKFICILEEVEIGVRGLKGQFWSDHSGDWWLRFVRMACQTDGDKYDYACIPILVMDYLFAPTEWIMANGDGGNESY